MLCEYFSNALNVKTFTWKAVKTLPVMWPDNLLLSPYLKSGSFCSLFLFFGIRLPSFHPHFYMVQIVWCKPAASASNLPHLKVLPCYNVPSAVVVNSCGCNCFYYTEAKLSVLKWWQKMVSYNPCLQNSIEGYSSLTTNLKVELLRKLLVAKQWKASCGR